jgi:hypothetical protein
MFGLRNEVVYHLATLHYLVWFIEWNEFFHHYFIPYKLKVIL